MLISLQNINAVTQIKSLDKNSNYPKLLLYLDQ